MEAERDRWQRPDDVLRMLDVREGSEPRTSGRVRDIRAQARGGVGHEGRVLAVDIRRTPLLFLRIRALLRGQNQLRVVRGDLDDPHLPAGAIDAVLVADTYHELTARTAVLEHAFRSLRPGGRLVIVDPTPGAGSEDGAETDTHRYERRAAAETELQRVGFAIVDRDDRFIDSSRHRWWMIVARRAEL